MRSKPRITADYYALHLTDNRLKNSPKGESLMEEQKSKKLHDCLYQIVNILFLHIHYNSL